MKSSIKHVELLDHLRGVAILAVLVFHTLGLAFGFDALPWKGWVRDFSGQTSFLYFLPVGMCAQAGVAIFFVVSGFCIHLSFQQQGQHWRGFFVRRFFRIYPAYLLALILSLLILATNPGLDFYSRDFWTQLLSHVFLVHNFDPATIYGANAALWSLAVETQLYLLYPVLLALAGRLGWRGALGVLAGCELLIRGLDGWTQTLDATSTVAGHVGWLLANSPLGYWFSWGLGAFIADAWLKQQPLPFMKLSSIWWLGLALGSNLVRPLCDFQFPLFALATAAFTARSLSGRFYGKDLAVERHGRTRSLPAEKSAPAGRAPSHSGPPASTPGFSSALLTKLGCWSYSIYLLHQPLLHVYSHVVVWAVPAENRPPPVGFLLLMVTWTAIIPLSYLWYKIIEVPGIALGKWINAAGEFRSNERPSALSVARPERLIIAVLVLGVVASLWVSDRFSLRVAVRNANLAWTLATSPDAAQRDGARAIKLAEDACLQTQYRQASIVETLAAAYAEAGRFDEAIGAGEMASALASQSGDEKLLQQYQEMLRLYQRHEAYREAPERTP